MYWGGRRRNMKKIFCTIALPLEYWDLAVCILWYDTANKFKSCLHSVKDKENKHVENLVILVSCFSHYWQIFKGHGLTIQHVYSTWRQAPGEKTQQLMFVSSSHSQMCLNSQYFFAQIYAHKTYKYISMPIAIISISNFIYIIH